VRVDLHCSPLGKQVIDKYLAITARNNLVTIRREFTAPDTKLAEGG
jgi:hypothetical protein